MPRYPNGRVPDEALVTFASGWLPNEGNWKHQLPPGTYRKHLALVALALRNTGRRLKPTDGWSCYRPRSVQEYAKRVHGIYAATPGTSSHGMFWEGRDCAAIDYGNWGYVYGGDRDRFYRDVRAVGLSPGLISPARGYPDEPWHVVDLDPWAGGATAGGNARPVEEDDMFDDDDRKLLKEVLTEIRNTKAGVWTGGTSGGRKFNYGILPIVAHNQTLIAQQSGRIAAIEEVVEQLAKSKGAVLDMKAVAKAAEQGAKQALKGLTLTADVDG